MFNGKNTCSVRIHFSTININLDIVFVHPFGNLHFERKSGCEISNYLIGNLVTYNFHQFSCRIGNLRFYDIILR